jgi:hypothetical protein
MGSAEDAEAGTIDRDLLPVHEDPEEITITGEDGIDEGLVVHALIVPRRAIHLPSVAVGVVPAAMAGVAAVVVW